jgi:DNA-binding NarL/FixJ family response regulator
MSGSKNDNDINRAYALGANAYLVKPTKFEDLVKMMESLKDYASWQGKSAQKATAHSQARTSPETWDAPAIVGGLAPA